MTLSQQLKNQKDQNAKIVGENYNLFRKVEELETKIVKSNYDFENEKRKAERLKEQNLKLEGTVIGLEAVIRILTNKENNLPFKYISGISDYYIKNGYSPGTSDEIIGLKFTELATEQFVQMFDKKETELDKWLKETKAKNLSLDELKRHIYETLDVNFYKHLKGYSHGITEMATELFNQWNNPTEESSKVETEWQPKRGDRVLVWNDDENEVEERIFLVEVKGCIAPILVVHSEYENEFKNNEWFKVTDFMNMKSLPTEQPKETDFKSQVIELVEKRIELYKSCEKESLDNCDDHDAIEYKAIGSEFKDFLRQIKQLC